MQKDLPHTQELQDSDLNKQRKDMKIYKLGEEILRQKCEPVKAEEINDEMRALFEEMFKTMISANGVGFFVLTADDDVKRVFINPEITKTSAETSEYEEGCLSIPGFSEKIIRPVKVSVAALNEFGKPFVIENADGLLARIIQHENDHLDGYLYIDRGDSEFAKQTEEQFKKRVERNAKKLAAREAKKASIEAKIAAKKAKKGK